MHVEDHPIEYGDFEGVIPPKQYGSGTVLLWDRGTGSRMGDAEAGYRQGKLKFALHGEKLHGGWMLVKSHGGKYGGDKSWLLIKERDEYARTGADAHIVDTEPRQRRVRPQPRSDRRRPRPRLALEQDRSPRTCAPAACAAQESRRCAGQDRRARARPRCPRRWTRELAMLVDDAPAGDGWLHEIKFDGYRMLCRIDDGKCRIVSRNGKDWTASFRAIADAVARLPVDIGVDRRRDRRHRRATAASSFQALQNVLSDESRREARSTTRSTCPISTATTCATRRSRRARRCCARSSATARSIRYSDHVEGNGPAFFEQACKLGLEGIISKRADSTYQAARGRDWQKIKCGMRQEFVIGGYTDPQGARSGFGALLLGVYDGKDAALLRQGRHRLQRRAADVARRRARRSARSTSRRSSIRRPGPRAAARTG